MTEAPLDKCPQCGAKPERLISGGAGLLFKGSGFYITDYRSNSYKSGASGDSGSSGSASSTGSKDTSGSGAPSSGSSSSSTAPSSEKATKKPGSSSE